MALIKIEPRTHKSEIRSPEALVINENLDGLLEINDKHVISFLKEGGPLSIYKDNIWDLTPYGGGAVRNQKVYFDSIKSNFDRTLSRRLLFITLFLTNGNDGLIKSPSTINIFYHQGLVELHKYASKRNFKMKQVLENNNLIISYIDYLSKNRSYVIISFIGLMNLLKSNSSNITDINYKEDNEVELKATSLALVVISKHKQTECIPVPILLSATRQRWNHIYNAIRVMSKLVKLIKLLILDPNNYRAITSAEAKKAKKNGEIFISFTEIICTLGLKKLFTIYDINGRSDFGNYLSNLQNTSRHLIHTFTGIRFDESLRLIVGCHNSGGTSIPPTITTTEKKSSKVLSKHSFVTIKEIKKVVDLNEEISKTISKYRFSDTKYLPLMITPSWIFSSKSTPSLKHISSQGRGQELPLNDIFITKTHVEEALKIVDPYRDWDNDKVFQVGKKWHFTYHQYRRSMAVYGLGSGLVSCADLGRQFKHFFNTITVHYGNGSFVASPMDDTDGRNHIKSFLDEQRHELDALSLQRDLLFNIKKLKSKKSPYADNKNSLNPNDIVMDRDYTQTIAKNLRKGMLFHKSTALGFCSSIEACDGHLMLLNVNCIECSHSGIDKIKLNNAIEGHREFGKLLNKKMPNSIESKTNNMELEIMINFQNKQHGEKHE